MIEEEKRASNEEEEEIIVRDRRRVTMEGTIRQIDGEPTTKETPPPGPQPPPQAGPPPQAEPGTGGEQQPQLADAYTLAKIMLMEFQARAWQYLGLIPNPVTNVVSSDLSQARFAIDMFAVVAEKLAEVGQLTNEEQRELQRVLSDLRINYVQRAGGGF